MNSFDHIGAIKIKDGLFIGDYLAASDYDFISSNKVTRIINCSGRQVSNSFESPKTHYLTYLWSDVEGQVC